MLDSIIAASTTGTTSSLSTVLLSIAIGIITGLLISVLYIKTNPGVFSQSLAITLVFMPAVISTIIMMVGENIAAAFSLAGIFTIIRFRSAPGSAKDILLILFGVGAGLAYGVQLYVYGIVFALTMVLVQYILFKTQYGKSRYESLQLKITTPEHMNNEAIFTEVIGKYARSVQLEQIATKDLGSVYQLIYAIELTKGQERKQMIDELRQHNSNLTISLNNRQQGQVF